MAFRTVPGLGMLGSDIIPNSHARGLQQSFRVQVRNRNQAMRNEAPYDPILNSWSTVEPSFAGFVKTHPRPGSLPRKSREDGLLLLPHLRRPRHSRTVSNMNHKKELQPLQGLGYNISNFKADGDSDLRASTTHTLIRVLAELTRTGLACLRVYLSTSLLPCVSTTVQCYCYCYDSYYYCYCCYYCYYCYYG